MLFALHGETLYARKTKAHAIGTKEVKPTGSPR
jgi:hypothetical protein